MNRAHALFNDVLERNYDGVKFYDTSDDFVKAYPELRFTTENPLWRDIKKKATPLGAKNSLVYNSEALFPMLSAEINYLWRMSMWIIKILQIIPAKNNKNLILQVLELCENVELNTGGGMSDSVKRVVLIYEKEGNVTSKKRKVEITSSSSSSSSSSTPSESSSSSSTSVTYAIPSVIELEEYVRQKTQKLEADFTYESDPTADFLAIYNLLKNDESYEDLNALVGAPANEEEADFGLIDLANYEEELDDLLAENS